LNIIGVYTPYQLQLLRYKEQKEEMKKEYQTGIEKMKEKNETNGWKSIALS